MLVNAQHDLLQRGGGWVKLERRLKVGKGEDVCCTFFQGRKRI